MKVESKILPLSKLKINPNNPRFIRDDKYRQLIKSIKDFPEMKELREIVCNDSFVVLGGNMRLRALKELGFKETLCKIVSGLTEDQENEFVIKDNLNYGEWDFDILANEFDENELSDYGFDVISREINDEKKVSMIKKHFTYENGTYTDDGLPYPITIIVTEKDYNDWLEIKNKLSITNDRDAFFHIIQDKRI